MKFVGWIIRLRVLRNARGGGINPLMSKTPSPLLADISDASRAWTQPSGLTTVHEPDRRSRVVDVHEHTTCRWPTDLHDLMGTIWLLEHSTGCKNREKSLSSSDPLQSFRALFPILSEIAVQAKPVDKNWKLIVFWGCRNVGRQPN